MANDHNYFEYKRLAERYKPATRVKKWHEIELEVLPPKPEDDIWDKLIFRGTFLSFTGLVTAYGWIKTLWWLSGLDLASPSNATHILMVFFLAHGALFGLAGIVLIIFSYIRGEPYSKWRLWQLLASLLLLTGIGPAMSIGIVDYFVQLIG